VGRLAGMTAVITGSGGRWAATPEAAVTAAPLANLLRRVSEPEDVANVIAFLCLPASRQITGQGIHTTAGAIVGGG
jgi:NAD(P)-dependent dehydrogenase (short-subunit alcohol dehydrogenase family)